MQLLDAYGNWAPTINQEPWTPGSSMFGGGGGLSGNGVPDNSLGDNGNIYVDLLTGDVYSKAGDSWTLVSPGTGSATQVYTGPSNDPIGDNVSPDDPSKPAIYYPNDTTNNIWRWIVADQTWNQSIG